MARPEAVLPGSRHRRCVPVSTAARRHLLPNWRGEHRWQPNTLHGVCYRLVCNLIWLYLCGFYMLFFFNACYFVVVGLHRQIRMVFVDVFLWYSYFRGIHLVHTNIYLYHYCTVMFMRWKSVIFYTNWQVSTKWDLRWSMMRHVGYEILLECFSLHSHKFLQLHSLAIVEWIKMYEFEEL